MTNRKRCRRALDKALTQEEWDALFANLASMARSPNAAVAVRAAELLLNYQFGPPGGPSPEEEEVEQIKIIQVHTPMPEPH